MSHLASTANPAPRSGLSITFPVRRLLTRVFNAFGLLVILFILFGVFFHSPGRGLIQASHSAAMQTARTIGWAMFAYAKDNHGHYPNGASSTEVFQKLLDEGYVTDPGIFYIPLPGKTIALSKKLKPENVSYDVTAGVDANAPDELPLVFMTGYKVTYVPGGAAIPLIKPYPPFWTRTWWGWWRGESGAPANAYSDPGPGIAVCYKSNSACFKDHVDPARPDYTIPDFIPSTFSPMGKTYRQITPDGPLP